MVGCCAYRCKSRSERKDPGITFHRFPVNNPEKLAAWIKNMHIAYWVPTKNDRICSKHFDQKCFYHVNDRTCLLDGAVPTLFQELPKYLQPKPKPARATKRPRERRDSKLSNSAEQDPLSSVEQNLDDTPRKKKQRRQLFQGVRATIKSETVRTKSKKLQQSETMTPTPSLSSIQPEQGDEMVTLSQPQVDTKKTDPSTKNKKYASRKRLKNMDLYIDEAQGKINENFDTLNNTLRGNRVKEDECDIYAKLLAKKLRKYPEKMRDRIMYEIDGLILDNLYPDEQTLSACPSPASQSPYSQNSTPSPAYVPQSPEHVNLPEASETPMLQFPMKEELSTPGKNIPPEFSVPTNSTNAIEYIYINDSTNP